MVDYTGERVIPKLMKPSDQLLLEHIARYDFAKPYVSGRVLDIACGSGYGTARLAKGRNKALETIIGADVDPEIIEFAHKEYYHPKMSFIVADGRAADLPDRLGTFDTVISFETIEHVSDDRQFFHNLISLLKPGGTLVLSTPIGRGRSIPSKSPFHYFELTEEEIRQLVSDGSPDIASSLLYFQNSVALEREKRPDVHYPIAVAVIQKK
ncbi:class I SAM-dependent methyltransferase [Salisediminibacterium selenitireducens]|uniref:Methyltransferase type 11 n=1 Tax=Bacillus selenitireducens (strain ATCC 700615 / DSM 15326 / MLS10) TaxID=439292 RepID=D6XXH8_BACIE|nr:methyltransferase domain-containing protein [Salisediminibacterium selenitireducens]ADH98035.1 Methyltransferase type 11 [[Bacillus] selenitireducens MLS10]